MSKLMENMQKRLMTLDADADQRAEDAAMHFANANHRAATSAALMAIERRLAAAMLFLIAILAEDEEETGI